MAPMERDFLETPVEEDAGIQKPIIPMSELGTTVPEQDPATGAHILQNIESNIRMGASQMQIVMSTPSTNPIGGRAKAYGKDVRRAIREMVEANQVDIVGLELPTSSNTNLSGFDGQRMTLNEDKRRRDIQEVKEAIDFAADIGGGGGVDIWSQEYVRSITDNNKINGNGKYRFYDYSEEELDYKDAIDGKKNDYDFNNSRVDSVKYVYDKRTGQVLKDIKTNNVIHAPKYMNAKEMAESKFIGINSVGKFSQKKQDMTGDGIIRENDYVDMTGEWLNMEDTEDQLKRVGYWNEKEERFETENIDWKGVVERTKEYNKTRPESEHIAPEVMAHRLQLESQILQSRGQSLYYTQQYEKEIRQIKKLGEDLEQLKKEDALAREHLNDEEYEIWSKQKKEEILGGGRGGVVPKNMLDAFKTPVDALQDEIRLMHRHLRHTHESSGGADARAREMMEMANSVTTLDNIAKQRTFDSYAELGLHAFDKTRELKNKGQYKKDLYVGPELGWPTAFGGHPEEFIEIIEGAREKMVKDLVTQKGVAPQEAKKLAANHIKGDFDTSHMAMWFNHFAKKDKNESDESRLKRFNKWFGEMVDKMVEKDVIGSIQVVDAINGQHSHLPPGQGVFPVIDATKKVYEAAKKKGKKIDIVSEGHEEERFGKGRILTETWKNFGASIGTGRYGAPGVPQTFRGVQSAYFGGTQPPTYVVGAYVPSNEWSLWSEVPFE